MLVDKGIVPVSAGVHVREAAVRRTGFGAAKIDHEDPLVSPNDIVKGGHGI
jgi:hypothetical protein